MHLILDLGLGERGAVVDAPVDRLQAAIDKAFFEKAVKGLEGAGLVIAGHGLVGLVPAAKAADALELRGLQVHVLLRISATCCEHLSDGQFQPFAAKFLFHLDLDGQSVAVEAGDVGSIKAGHGLRFDDEVLEAFVKRVAQVDGAVGVGRAVVQNVGGAASACLAQLFVETQRGPAGEAKWLIQR